ncbi:MAG: tripartite tricarboxylate transporter TctB family protein [Vibrio hibernica]
MIKSETTAIRPMRKINVDSIIGLISTLVGLILIIFINPDFIQVPSHVANPLLSPNVLPNIIAGFLVLVGLVLIVHSLTDHQVKIIFEFDYSAHWLKKCLLILALLVYVFGFEAFGALISAVLATCLLFFAGGIRKPAIYLLAIAAPFLVCLFFEHIVNVPLPTSFWSY